ncbi:MAG: DNA repair protein RadA [Rhabdochlamydiaceae bacterium]
MAKSKIHWVCQDCGHKQIKWSGSCPVCQNWNTFKEETEIVYKEERFESKNKVGSKPLRIREIKQEKLRRESSAFLELDRLMGGGVVPGSLILLGGDPGIGKSTLMLQIAQNFAKQGLTVLYVCGEESAEQTSLRAHRLGVNSDLVYLLSETNFSLIKMSIDDLKPDILVVDSIQIVYKTDIPSAPGSVSQVRELATEFMHIAKGIGISTFLIGHVTKSGDIAGPKVLEHIVDTVLDFEGDKHHGYRLLRSIKNRFGPTDEMALFQMSFEGLKEIDNPSALFLQERMKDVPGCVIIPTLEGSRSILVEVQALVAPSSFATPSRRSSGIDQNRLALLLAVLEKRLGLHLYQNDVFVSVAGGMKILEPAIDLGVAMAIISSFWNHPISSETILIGEIGLSGEIRSVSRIENRIKEAVHMGFSRCVLPKHHVKSLSKELSNKIQLVGVEFVEDAIKCLMGR